MKRPDLVNLYFSIFLIVVGVISFLLRYFEAGDFQFTSLIPAFFGVILLPMTKPIKNENHVIAHTAVIIALIFTAVVTYMFIKNLGGGEISRKLIVFGVSMLGSFAALVFYIGGFFARKKDREGK